MIKTVTIITLAIALTGCNSGETSNKSTQAEKAKTAANSIKFVENAEIENIKRRLELTSSAGLMGYIILLNETGQPVMYTGVKGKITSGSKRLTEPDRSGSWGAGTNNVVRSAPSDEGTFGTSDEYIFFWTQNGQYIQWNGKYLYSDKPFKLNVQPIVVDVK